MADAHILTGWGFNLLARALSITPSSEDAAHVRKLLNDGDPQTYFQFGGVAPGTDEHIPVDLCDVPNPGLESWSGGVPASWSKTGTVTEETTNVRSGSSAALVNAGATLEVEYEVRAGQERTEEAWADCVSGGTAGLRIWNPHTNKYLQSDGTWSATPADCATTTATTYTLLAKTFTVESFDACAGPTTRLRKILRATTQNVNFDDAPGFPSWDFLALIGHSVDPRVAITLRSSNDDFVANDVEEAAPTVRYGNIYAVLAAPVAKRWARVKFGGANSSATGRIGICQLVLGRSLRIASRPQVPLEIEWDQPQFRHATPAGAEYVVPQSETERRRFSLRFRHGGTTKYEEARDEVFRRAGGGRHRIVFVPLDTEPMVIYGTVDRIWGTSGIPAVVTDATMVIGEMPRALPVAR